MTVVPLALAVPLLAAAGLAALGSLLRGWMVNIVALSATAASAVFLAIVFARSGAGEIVYWYGGWKVAHGIVVGVSFTIDPIGAGMALFVVTLMLAALVFGVRYLQLEEPYYSVIMLVFMAGMIGLSLSGDLFDMFVFFELMSVSAYALSGYKVKEAAPIEGSLNFGITNSLGSFLLITGIAFIYARTGQLNLAGIGSFVSHHGGTHDGLTIAAFTLLTCGFFIKAAIVPFHFWVADAYAVAPTPVCILFAGAMSELGLYAVARVAVAAFGTPHVATVLVVFGMTTAVLGGVMAVMQEHLKRMLAFAVVSYLGVFLAAGGLLDASGIAGAAVYIVGDGLVKAALFALIGIVQHRRGKVGLAALHGRGRDLPFTGALVVLGGLGLAAMPPFGTFLGKSMIEDALIDRGYDAAIPFVVLSALLCGAAVLRAAGSIFLGWGPREGGPASDEETEPESDEAQDRTPAVMWVPVLAMLGLSIAVGVIPGVEQAALRAAARFTDHHGYLASVLHGAPAHVPPHPEGRAPTWYDDLYGAISAAGAVAVALLVLFRRRLRWPRLTARGAAVASRGLRALHSGRVGDYVAWLVLGVALFGGSFALALR